MSFDTTAGDTGRLKKACTLLELKLGRELLWLVCHHHIMELILSKVFTLCCGSASAPEIPIFKRFKAVWKGIAQDNFRGLNLKEGCYKEATTKFIREVIGGDRQVRDDDQELIELMLISLGLPPPVIHWGAPGPVHHSRWMVKHLHVYSLKIVLFREQ